MAAHAHATGALRWSATAVPPASTTAAIPASGGMAIAPSSSRTGAAARAIVEAWSPRVVDTRSA
jgi:hypothetical protein